MTCCTPTILSPQPALYEAFGLTVVEAMTCGLPTFATCNGGPSEIIKHGKSGFHIDPYHGDAVRGQFQHGGSWWSRCQSPIWPTCCKPVLCMGCALLDCG
jgi:glycogen synthase